MSCSVTVFGKPLAPMKLADSNLVRSILHKLDDCEDCLNFLEALKLQEKWYKQRVRG